MGSIRVGTSIAAEDKRTNYLFFEFSISLMFWQYDTSVLPLIGHNLPATEDQSRIHAERNGNGSVVDFVKCVILNLVAAIVKSKGAECYLLGRSGIMSGTA